jgi:hypothetical protein
VILGERIVVWIVGGVDVVDTDPSTKFLPDFIHLQASHDLFSDNLIF